jgi:hypothetical protein
MRTIHCELTATVLLAWCLLLCGCSSNQQAQQGTGEKTASSDDLQEAQKDIASGNLTFELRGLTNESSKREYGGTTYMHTAVVVPVGNSKYTKMTYLVVYSAKRLAGGDPESPRKDDDIEVVVVRDGIGRFASSGGYRTKEEKWDPEHIEVRPIVAFVGTPTNGTPVQER